MTDQPTMLITEHNGQEVMSTDALSLLFGVPADDITAHMKNTLIDDMNAFPAEWLKAGRRRVKEASAVTGANELLGILRYYARKELDAEIVLIDNESGA